MPAWVGVRAAWVRVRGVRQGRWEGQHQRAPADHRAPACLACSAAAHGLNREQPTHRLLNRVGQRVPGLQAVRTNGVPQRQRKGHCQRQQGGHATPAAPWRAPHNVPRPAARAYRVDHGRGLPRLRVLALVGVDQAPEGGVGAGRGSSWRGRGGAGWGSKCAVRQQAGVGAPT